MSTDPDNKLNGAPEPFRRPMTWGRPPATVFRAGPLPKGERLPPLPEPPRRSAGANILSGSMIPHATPSQQQVIGPLVARAPDHLLLRRRRVREIGRASCRERV